MNTCFFMYYIIYLLFGKSKNELKNELCYSLLSLDKCTDGNKGNKISIVIYTDSQLEGLPNLSGKVNVLLQYVEESEIMQMIQSANGYPYIVKAFILEAFLKTFNACGLFVDTDTFFIKDPMPLFNIIEQGNPVMHINEYPIVQYPNVKNYMESETFTDTAGSVFKTGVHFSMWNSGAIGIGPSHSSLLPHIASLIQQMASSRTFKVEGKRLSEQLAFSYYFEQSTPGIRSAEAYIIHYWFFKEARYLLGNYFNRFFGSDEQSFSQLLNNRTELLDRINQVNYENIPLLIFELMRAFNLLEYYHYKALPAESRIGKQLRAGE